MGGDADSGYVQDAGATGRDSSGNLTYGDDHDWSQDTKTRNSGGIIALNYGGDAMMYRNNGGTIQMAAQQVAGLANKASEAAMQAQEAVNEVAGVIGSNGQRNWMPPAQGQSINRLTWLW